MGSRSREGNMYNFPPGATFPTRSFSTLYLCSPLIGNKLIKPESSGKKLFWVGRKASWINLQFVQLCLSFYNIPFIIIERSADRLYRLGTGLGHWQGWDTKRVVTLTGLLYWQGYYTNKVVTLTGWFHWQGCYTDRGWKLTRLLHWQGCYSDKVVTLTGLGH